MKSLHSAVAISGTESYVVNDGGVQLSIDEYIAYVARVSNPSNQFNTMTSQQLLRYLAKHKHWSPFES